MWAQTLFSDNPAGTRDTRSRAIEPIALRSTDTSDATQADEFACNDERAAFERRRVHRVYEGVYRRSVTDAAPRDTET